MSGDVVDLAGRRPPTDEKRRACAECGSEYFRLEACRGYTPVVLLNADLTVGGWSGRVVCNSCDALHYAPPRPTEESR